MKILKAEVKSIYTIAVNADDYAKAKNNWCHDDTAPIKFPEAFDNDNTGHMSELEEMKHNFSAHFDRAAYLASYLGFDGWENIGYFDDASNTLRMTFFNYGDCLH